MNPESPDMFFLSLGCQGVFHRENINYNGPLSGPISSFEAKFAGIFSACAGRGWGSHQLKGIALGCFGREKKIDFIGI
jgi:hypothetical protein